MWCTKHDSEHFISSLKMNYFLSNKIRLQSLFSKRLLIMLVCHHIFTLTKVKSKFLPQS